MWSLKFGNFTEDFIGNNLDNYHESLSLCNLESDQFFSRCKRYWIDAYYNNPVEAHCLKDYRHFLGPQFITIGRLKNFNVIQLEIGGNGDSRQRCCGRNRLLKFKAIWFEANASSSISSRRRYSDGSCSSCDSIEQFEFGDGRGQSSSEGVCL
jgi:hypothetical protein